MRDPFKLCVLGNSHLGAAKAGWDSIARDHPEVSTTFFGAPWDMMKDIQREGTQLVAGTDRLRRKLEKSSGGLGAIDLTAFDAVVLYGLQFGPRRIIQLYRTDRPASFEWPDVLEVLPPMRRIAGPYQRIPERLFDKAALAALRDSLAVRLAELVREAIDIPIVIVAAPGFSERVLDEGDWDGVLGAGDHLRLADRYADLAKRACPDGVPILFPREGLTAHAIFTARGHAAPDSKDGKPDQTHTGPAYGAEMVWHATKVAIREINRRPRAEFKAPEAASA